MEAVASASTAEECGDCIDIDPPSTNSLASFRGNSERWDGLLSLEQYYLLMLHDVTLNEPNPRTFTSQCQTWGRKLWTCSIVGRFSGA